MSKEVPKFLNDPLQYVSKVCINLQTESGGGASASDFNANFAYEDCFFDLVPWSTGIFSVFASVDQVILSPTKQGGPDLIRAYYVPYIAYGVVANGGKLVPLDNVPAEKPPHKFIFTGGQNGCSLLLMKGTKPNTVCALHYPNSDGKAKGFPLLANMGKTAADIILSIDFDLYGEAANPNACSFFYYNQKEWIGVTQSQIQGMPDMERKRPTMSINDKKGVQIVGK